MKTFGLSKFESEEQEKELDYLSENELKHRDDEDNIFNIIRKSKKIEEKVKDMHFKLKVMNRLVLQNLTNLKEEILTSGVKNIDSIDVFRFDSDEISKAVFEIKKEEVEGYKKRAMSMIKSKITRNKYTNDAERTPTPISPRFAPESGEMTRNPNNNPVRIKRKFTFQLDPDNF